MPTIFRIGLVVAAIVAVAILAFSSLNVSPPGSTVTPPTQVSIPFSSTMGLPPELLGRPVTPPPPNAEWLTIFEVGGAESVKSTPFRLSGNTAKLKFNVQLIEGNAAGIFAAYILPEEAQTQTGFPDLFIGVPNEGEQLVSRPAGSYILSVQSFGSSWTIQVEEATQPSS